MKRLYLAAASAALATFSVWLPALAADPGSRIGSPATRLPPTGTPAPSKAEIRPSTSGVRVGAARVIPPQTSIGTLKAKFDPFASSAAKFEDMAKAIPGVIKQCADKAYNAQDQKTAGCLATDSVQQCSDKLVKYCIANFSNVLSVPTFGLRADSGGGVVTTGFTMQQFLQSGQATAAEASALSQSLNLYAGQVEQAVKTAAP